MDACCFLRTREGQVTSLEPGDELWFTCHQNRSGKTVSCSLIVSLMRQSSGCPVKLYYDNTRPNKRDDEFVFEITASSEESLRPVCSAWLLHLVQFIGAITGMNLVCMQNGQIAENRGPSIWRAVAREQISTR